MRSTYWDSCKGVAIIAVVIIHACGSALGFPEGSVNWKFGLILRQFINFAVPAFLAISGLFSARKMGESLGSFYSKRLLRIIPPYIIWSFISMALRKPDHFIQPKLFFYDLLVGTGMGVGYFVIVLIQFILLTPLIWQIKSRRSHVLIMLVMLCISVFVSYLTKLANANSVLAQFPFFCIFISWYPFYHLGVYVAEHTKEFDSQLRQLKPYLLPLLVLGLGFSLVEGFSLGYQGMTSFGASQMKISSFFTSIILFMIALSFQSKDVFFDKPPIVWLGRCSYIIYLSHLFFLGQIDFILQKSNQVYQMQPLYIFLLSTLTLIGCFLMIVVFSIFLPDRILKYYLGGERFEPVERFAKVWNHSSR